MDTWDHAELQMLHTYHMQSLQTLSDQPSYLNPTSNHQGIIFIKAYICKKKVLNLYWKIVLPGNSNILSQHLQNLNLHQAPLVNVPKNQGKNFLFHFRIYIKSDNNLHTVKS